MENITTSVFRWILATLAVGVVCGLVGVAFGWLTVTFDTIHQDNFATLFLLPVSGVVTVFVYDKMGIAFNTDAPTIITAQRQGTRVAKRLAPALMACVPLSLLGGCSVGRIAAGLQIGGSLASAICEKASDQEQARRVLILAGMASMVSALMFTPFAAFVFVMEIARMKLRQMKDWRMLSIPVAALISYAIAVQFGEGRIIPLEPARPEVWVAVAIALVLGGVCAGLGRLFVLLLKSIRTLVTTNFRSNYIRMLLGSAIIIVLVLLFGTSDASGSGLPEIETALGGDAVPLPLFAEKLVLTAVCLAFGFKGGAITPTIAVGACAGCTAAQLVGGPVAFMTAIGMVAIISAAARAPLAATIMGVELFGIWSVPYFAIAAALGAVAARKDSLYGGINWLLDTSKWTR